MAACAASPSTSASALVGADLSITQYAAICSGTRNDTCRLEEHGAAQRGPPPGKAAACRPPAGRSCSMSAEVLFRWKDCEVNLKLAQFVVRLPSTTGGLRRWAC